MAPTTAIVPSKAARIELDPNADGVFGHIVEREIEIDRGATLRLRPDRAGCKRAIRADFDEKLVLGGPARKLHGQGQGPGARRQHDMRSLKQKASPTGDIDRAGGPLVRPVAEKEQVVGPGDRQRFAVRLMLEIGSQRAAYRVPRGCRQTAPPGNNIVPWPRGIARGQALNQIGKLGVVYGNLQMARYRCDGGRRLRPIALALQHQRACRRAIT